MSVIKSKPQTREFDEGYERIFGNRKPQRGRWVWDEVAGKLVSAEDYVPPSRSGTNIMVDRFYENTCALDGTDIGSRAKHREYMRQHGLAPADDFKEHPDRMRKQQELADARERRETIGRAAYRVFDKPGIEERPKYQRHESDKLPNGWA